MHLVSVRRSCGARLFFSSIIISLHLILNTIIWVTFHIMNRLCQQNSGDSVVEKKTPVKIKNKLVIFWLNKSSTPPLNSNSDYLTLKWWRKTWAKSNFWRRNLWRANMKWMWCRFQARSYLPSRWPLPEINPRRISLVKQTWQLLAQVNKPVKVSYRARRR